METQISIPVQTRRFLDLAEFLESKGDSRDPVLAVSDAIDYWMSNADWKPELLKVSSTLGYQWKSLFLPDGTEVRMQYKGNWYYAKVEGDKLMYEGEAITPGRLANTISGTSRNAWRDLWIKRLADSEWLLADDCRGEAEQT
ncbi:hypothetical protein AVMA1855_23915 [Acidovorax sp. SUPP1855]|uniref:hypothetical protein n=1 Tax=Acidovorax sp. SUPP1855 TaxID=431774 RepID=UPI0023DE5396|nr:hypothetical protein [Acidovorax sp. SUPP1855]GKS87257.1 hypothetical protein AVMA1855_23915 [Acidovorax sp. SUPP1855]